MLTFFVPPGIGDFSAMYAKLCKLEREVTIRPSVDRPNRISEYLDILPRIRNGGYSANGANLTLARTLPPKTDLQNLPDGEYFLAINTWLEGGGKAADWIPGPTEYHYQMLKPMEHFRPAYDFLKNIPPGLQVGVYCSAYGNSRHWGFWGFEEWKTFLGLVVKALPDTTNYIFIGAEYDLGISENLFLWAKCAGLRAHNAVGKFHIAGTLEIIRSLNYFFVFPSGLGFLADVLRTPNLMWFPSALDLMRGTFCDPEQYESGRTLHRLFSTPEEAFEDWKQNGLKFAEEVYESKNCD